MNYIVTEPGLTHLTYAQKLTPTTYNVLVKAFGADDHFSVAPYSVALQQQLRKDHPTDSSNQSQQSLIESVAHYA